MEQLASDACTNRRVTCILNRICWQRGCVGGVSGHCSGAASCSRYFAAAKNQKLAMKAKM